MGSGRGADGKALRTAQRAAREAFERSAGEALDVCRRALDAAGGASNVDGRHGYGLLLMYGIAAQRVVPARLEEAEMAYRRAVELDSGNAIAYRALAKLFREADKVEETACWINKRLEVLERLIAIERQSDPERVDCIENELESVKVLLAAHSRTLRKTGVLHGPLEKGTILPLKVFQSYFEEEIEEVDRNVAFECRVGLLFIAQWGWMHSATAQRLIVEEWINSLLLNRASSSFQAPSAALCFMLQLVRCRPQETWAWMALGIHLQYDEEASDNSCRETLEFATSECRKELQRMFSDKSRSLRNLFVHSIVAYAAVAPVERVKDLVREATSLVKQMDASEATAALKSYMKISTARALISTAPSKPLKVLRSIIDSNVLNPRIRQIAARVYILACTAARFYDDANREIMQSFGSVSDADAPAWLLDMRGYLEFRLLEQANRIPAQLDDSMNFSRRLRAAKRLAPYSGSIALHLGQVYWAMDGKYKEDRSYAHSELLAAVRYDPSLSEAWVLLGDWYRIVKRDSNRCVRCYQRALRISPADEHAATSVYDLLRDQDINYATLIDMLERAVADRPGTSAWALKKLRTLFQSRMNWTQVISCSQQLIALDKHDPETWSQIGAAYRHAGKFQAATKALRRAVELAPDRVAFRLQLCSTLHLQHDYDEARAILGGNEQNYSGIGVRLLLAHNELYAGVEARNCGALSYAKQCFMRCIEIVKDLSDRSNSLLVQRLIGCSLLHQFQLGDEGSRRDDDINTLLEYFKRCVNLFPDRNFVWRDFGIAQFICGRSAEARISLEHALRLDRTDSLAWVALGLACHPMDILSQRCFVQAIELDPQNAAAYCALALVGQRDSSFRNETILRAQAVDPTLALVWMTKALTFSSNIGDQALACWTRAYELRSCRSSCFGMSLSTVLFHAKKADFFTFKALEYAPNDSRFIALRAAALYRMKRYGAAAKLLLETGLNNKYRDIYARAAGMSGIEDLCLAVDPATNISSLSYVHFASERFEDAALGWESSGHIINAALSLARSDRVDDALSHLQPHIQNDSIRLVAAIISSHLKIDKFVQLQESLNMVGIDTRLKLLHLRFAIFRDSSCLSNMVYILPAALEPRLLLAEYILEHESASVCAIPELLACSCSRYSNFAHETRRLQLLSCALLRLGRSTHCMDCASVLVRIQPDRPENWQILDYAVDQVNNTCMIFDSAGKRRSCNRLDTLLSQLVEGDVDSVLELMTNPNASDYDLLHCARAAYFANRSKEIASALQALHDPLDLVALTLTTLYARRARKWTRAEEALRIAWTLYGSLLDEDPSLHFTRAILRFNEGLVLSRNKNNADLARKCFEEAATILPQANFHLKSVS